MIFSAVNICLIVLCITPRSSSNLITFKYKDFEHQQYPFKKSADWISNMTKNDDRILFLPMPPAYYLYIERIYSDRDKINHERLVYFTPSMVKDIIYPTQKLKEFCYAENISYILFPFGPKNSFPDIGSSNEAKYLEAISDAAFIEVARFNLEDNYLIIYKIMK
jgi:hypothetical protein